MDFVDHRRDPQAWASALGVSRAAVDLYLSSDVVDLHVDTFLWTRMVGYDLRRRHGPGLFGGKRYSQVDLPRAREARITGAIWSITTNPVRTAAGRARTFARNLARLRRIFESCPEDVALVRDAAGYRAAVAAGKHAAMIGIQGGNAVDRDPDALDLLGDVVVRVTLVHLSHSRLGTTSAPSPLRRDEGLTAAGREFVRGLDRRRVFVDLAHISRRGFWDAVDVHDRSRPLIVTHTGVCGVAPHWRNLDDEQLRAIADSGGTVGIMYHLPFLGPTPQGAAVRVVEHMEHVVKTVGDDFASLGSDWDGVILPPAEIPTCLELPRLAQIMLDRGWREDSVRKVLGGNFVRALALLRG